MNALEAWDALGAWMVTETEQMARCDLASACYPECIEANLETLIVKVQGRLATRILAREQDLPARLPRQGRPAGTPEIRGRGGRTATPTKRKAGRVGALAVTLLLKGGVCGRRSCFDDADPGRPRPCRTVCTRIVRWREPRGAARRPHRAGDLGTRQSRDRARSALGRLLSSAAARKSR